MGTQDSGLTAEQIAYFAPLTDGELAIVAHDRHALLQDALNVGDYEAAGSLRVAVQAVNREVERRIGFMIEQGKALRMFMTAGVVLVPSPEEAAQWGDAGGRFTI